MGKTDQHEPVQLFPDPEWEAALRLARSKGLTTTYQQLMAWAADFQKLQVLQIQTFYTTMTLSHAARILAASLTSHLTPCLHPTTAACRRSACSALERKRVARHMRAAALTLSVHPSAHQQLPALRAAALTAPLHHLLQRKQERKNTHNHCRTNQQGPCYGLQALAEVIKNEEASAPQERQVSLAQLRAARSAVAARVASAGATATEPSVKDTQMAGSDDAETDAKAAQLAQAVDVLDGHTVAADSQKAAAQMLQRKVRTLARC